MFLRWRLVDFTIPAPYIHTYVYVCVGVCVCVFFKWSRRYMVFTTHVRPRFFSSFFQIFLPLVIKHVDFIRSIEVTTCCRNNPPRHDLSGPVLEQRCRPPGTRLGIHPNPHEESPWDENCLHSGSCSPALAALILPSSTFYKVLTPECG